MYRKIRKLYYFTQKTAKKLVPESPFPGLVSPVSPWWGKKHRPGSISTCTTCNNHGLATGVGSWYLWIPMEKLSNHSPIGFPHLQNKHGTILLILLTVNYSGQISSRPHTTDFPQMVVNCKGNPRLFQGNLGWWNIMNHLARNLEDGFPGYASNSGELAHKNRDDALIFELILARTIGITPQIWLWGPVTWLRLRPKFYDIFNGRRK